MTKSVDQPVKKPHYQVHQNELLVQAKAGDVEAFEQIMKAYEGVIWRMYTMQAIRAQPKDWVHECRIVLFKTLQNLRILTWGTFTVYYKRALAHHVMNVYRREFSQPELALEEPVLALLNDVEATRTESLVDLIEIVKPKLRGKQKALLAYRLEGYTMKEAAAEMGCALSLCYYHWNIIQSLFEDARQTD